MRIGFAALAILLLNGCGDSDSGGGTRTTMTVHPGESIQAAVNAASAHTTILVEPGVYHDSPGAPTAVTISKQDIQLIGESTPDQPVVLENSGGQQNGIVVAPMDSSVIAPGEEHPGEHPPCGNNGGALHGFTLRGFTVRGFDQFGVYLACVDGFTLSHNSTDADRLYGLFPVRSHNGTMDNNDAQNTTLDAALYVGQSDHITITANSTHDNLLGLEIENSSDITATQNQVFNNTLGIIADVMPGLQKTDQVNVMIADNDVHDNNHPNTGTANDTQQTPPGTGLVVLGGSTVTVQNNQVSDNGFAGIIVASYCTGVPSCTNLDIDPDPRHIRVTNNELSGNGHNPPPDPLEAGLAADLVWDKTGTDNCWAGNSPSATIKVLSGGRQLPACE